MALLHVRSYRLLAKVQVEIGGTYVSAVDEVFLACVGWHSGQLGSVNDADGMELMYPAETIFARGSSVSVRPITARWQERLDWVAAIAQLILEQGLTVSNVPE